MSALFYLFYPWGVILQGVAIVHFIRRRPDTYWLWIIVFGGGLGALVYIAAEVLPDAGLLRQSFKVFPRRKRIRELEAAILDNPSAGNYEELANRKERKRYSSRRLRFPRSQKPITTMTRFWLLRIEMRKRKSGRSEFWRRSQPCRDICAAASGPGSEERTVSVSV